MQEPEVSSQILFYQFFLEEWHLRNQGISILPAFLPMASLFYLFIYSVLQRKMGLGPSLASFRESLFWERFNLLFKWSDHTLPYMIGYLKPFCYSKIWKIISRIHINWMDKMRWFINVVVCGKFYGLKCLSTCTIVNLSSIIHGRTGSSLAILVSEPSLDSHLTRMVLHQTTPI